MSGGRGDFWSNLLKERAASTSASSSTSVADIASDIPQTINQQVIFIGDAGAGKSSLIQTFLKPNAVKDTKPTVALEFNFARKTSNNTKYVANLWEVGGDFLEGSYLEIPLTKDTLGSQSCAIVLVVDLSKPQNAVVSVLRSIASIREVLKRKLAELQAIAVHQVNDLKEKTAQSYKGHPDSNKVKPLEIPLVIIANKQDLMKTMSVAERRAIIQSLRFIAHYFGAILMTVSANDVYMKESFRGLLNSLCFNAALKPCHETNLEKMIFITRGQDSFENILLGHLASPENNVESAKYLLISTNAEMDQFITQKGVTRACWNRITDHIASLFGESDPLPSLSLTREKKELEYEENENSEDSNNPFPETEVDDMRAVRDLALARYVQEMERKQEMAAKMNTRKDGNP